jgi:hypothetical protein
MSFYTLGYVGTMTLPIRSFWMMNANIDRLTAQKDMRALTVAVCGQGGEAAQAHREQLILEVGTVVKLDDSPMSAANTARDESGFADLKAMSSNVI